MTSPIPPGQPYQQPYQQQPYGYEPNGNLVGLIAFVLLIILVPLILSLASR